ncbi:hypothetical protein ABT160_31110 [Streptomyces sp. NPDC001941]|uniref:hypothetical protein n=1 Tax=Streptomyces sp. NPDC001941 TaxID=3154659 RepID=UPI00332B3F24
MIEEQAAAVDADGRTRAASQEEVNALLRFEERYGGLWYPVLGSNGMDHGLEGEPVVHEGPYGWKPTRSSSTSVPGRT